RTSRSRPSRCSTSRSRWLSSSHSTPASPLNRSRRTLTATAGSRPRRPWPTVSSTTSTPTPARPLVPPAPSPDHPPYKEFGATVINQINSPYGGLQVPVPSSRYILPQFEERTSYGMKRTDPYTKLFEDRIIFLGVQIDDASADDVIAQLLVLESQDPDRDILMYINSPG